MVKNMVNVGKYTIHGWEGDELRKLFLIDTEVFDLFLVRVSVCLILNLKDLKANAGFMSSMYRAGTILQKYNSRLLIVNF